ncbi:tyrosine-protein phosphatase [Lysinibacillus xylanilyticus]|uniref:tyrosine-protein phosphatase n=1 Tax=Lysinibacillus xylanilyticus TaxID=582475 RepID=UPI00380E8C4E
MVDMHAHILYGVDDGPKTEEESLKMLEQAKNEGITEIISTSHAMHPRHHVSYMSVDTGILHLRKLLVQNDLQIKLHTGHEVRLNDQVNTLFHHEKLHTLANSQFVLLELPSSTVPLYTKDIIIALKTAGYTPIIAHPERNLGIAQNPLKLVPLIQQGALTQVTAGSLSGHFGKSVQQLALNLVQANYVHTYGSDAHDVKTRPFLFKAGLHYLEKQKEFSAIDRLLENNVRIVRNRPIPQLELDEIRVKKWWKIF